MQETNGPYARFENTNPNAGQPAVVTKGVRPLTPESILVAYGWYMDARRTFHDFGPNLVPLGMCMFTQEFKKTVVSSETLGILEVSEGAVNKMKELSAAGDRKGVAVLAEKCLRIAFDKRFGDGNVSESSVFVLDDGSPNSPVIMKELRRYDEGLRRHFHLWKSGEIKGNVHYEAKIEPAVLEAISSNENLSKFFTDIGLGDAEFKSVSWCRENHPENYEKTLYKYIFGKKEYYDANTHKTLSAIPMVMSAARIYHEFDDVADKLHRLAMRFIYENDIRLKNKAGGKYPPFSDEFLYALHDRDVLEGMEFPQNVVELVMSKRLPPVDESRLRYILCPSGRKESTPGYRCKDGSVVPFRTDLPPISDEIRGQLSYRIGFAGKDLGIVKEAVSGLTANKSKPLTDESGIAAYIKRLTVCNGITVQSKDKESKDRGTYPADVLKATFHPELLGQAWADLKAVHYDGDRIPYIDVIKQWINLMPEDSPIFELGVERHILLKALDYAAAHPDMSTVELASIAKDPAYIWINAGFMMFVQKNWTDEDMEDVKRFWSRLSDGQADSLRMLLGKTILDKAKAYKYDHPDMFPRRIQDQE